MYILPGVSNTCLFAPAPYYKLNKGFFLGFLFKPLSGLCPPHGLNKKASEKYPLSITYCGERLQFRYQNFCYFTIV